jgi:putative membrane-bound dehydrogenase-like protein
MGRTYRLALALFVASLAPVPVPAGAQVAEVIPHAQDRPPGPAKSPAEAIAAMTLPPGFVVELVAAEPQLVNPVAMTFDERGRIWVTESLEYPRREPGPGRDRVKVLEDTDGDGKVDKTTLFAEGLNIPSGIAVGHGGVWVANSPDILFYPDADRDAVADGPPRVVVTGFGRDDTHELPNALTWGPDGWLYGWNGVFNASAVKDHNGVVRKFTCAVYRIHPRTRAFEVWCEGTSNPWGIAFNERGDLFSSACVIDHLWHLAESAYYVRQGGPYPPHTRPMGSIVDHQHQKAAYCGITWLDSPAFPPAYRGRLVMGNIHGNALNVDRLERVGATYRAEPEADLLAANDAWFMPVVQKVGPDGALYVLDWYDRYHCYQDANRDPAGIDRLKGRLYRIRHADFPLKSHGDLGAKRPDELAALLGDANVYVRETARRLLVERGDGGAAAGAPGSLEALWARIGAGRLDAAAHREVLAHPDASFRAWAVRALGDLARPDASLLDRLPAMAADASPEVRLQVAVAAAKRLPPGRAVPVLMAVLARSADDPLIPHVVWENLKRAAGPAELARLEEHARAAGAEAAPAVAAIWPRVLALAIDEPRVDAPALARLFTFGLGLPGDAAPREVVAALADGLRDEGVTGDRLAALRVAIEGTVRERLANPADPLRLDLAALAVSWKAPAPEAAAVLREVARDRAAEAPRRLEAIGALIDADLDDEALLDGVAAALADPDAPGRLRSGLLEVLGRCEDPGVAPRVLASYDRLSPDLKPRAIELLAQRPGWSKALLEAVAAGKVPSAAVGVNQLRRLQASSDPGVREVVRRLYGTVREGRNPKRELVVGQMRNFLRKTPGDATAGVAVFTRLCAQCHKIHGAGQEVGPDITLNGRNDFDQLVSNVFDPNLVIGPAYQATTVATADGRVLTGLLAEDSPERVVLKVQGGTTEVVPRADVEQQATSPLSLMPEELEAQLTPQEIADLFAFLALDRPPGDPKARRLPGAP